ncbi:hypothetical protein ABBQ38_002774 [Trebouxia sp. C0009 RCD-2024]
MVLQTLKDRSTMSETHRTTSPATASSPQIQNAAEAIQMLTEDAAELAARLGHLSAALQQSASKDVTSTLQHLALYEEAVQTLQVVTTLP